MTCYDIAHGVMPQDGECIAHTCMLVKNPLPQASTFAGIYTTPFSCLQHCEALPTCDISGVQLSALNLKECVACSSKGQEADRGIVWHGGATYSQMCCAQLFCVLWPTAPLHQHMMKGPLFPTCVWAADSEHIALPWLLQSKCWGVGSTSQSTSCTQAHPNSGSMHRTTQQPTEQPGLLPNSISAEDNRK
jgi:hypothetical protein